MARRLVTSGDRVLFCGMLITACLLCSCAGPSSSNMRGWEGAHINRVIAAFGAPKQVLDDGSGGSIYVFSEAYSVVLPSTTTTTATVTGYTNAATGIVMTTSTPAQNISAEDFRAFYVDSKGIVINWAYRDAMWGTTGNSWSDRESRSLQASQDSDGGSVWKVDKAPVPISRSTPEYPDEAREQGLTGTVHVSALIGVNGRVSSIGKVEGPVVFHRAAIVAAMQWVFEPAEGDGKTVEAWVRLPFTFSVK
jgi:TonB family protein